MNTPKADPPDYSDSKSDADGDRTPRWVKAFGIIAIALFLLFIILHLTGYSPHHTSPREHIEQQP